MSFICPEELVLSGSIFKDVIFLSFSFVVFVFYPELKILWFAFLQPLCSGGL